MGNDLVRENTELKRRLLIAELRSKDIRFTYEVPPHIPGTSSAYHSGYEAGWRDWDVTNSYKSRRHYNAFRDGKQDGRDDLMQAARAAK